MISESGPDLALQLVRKSDLTFIDMYLTFTTTCLCSEVRYQDERHQQQRLTGYDYETQHGKNRQAKLQATALGPWQPTARVLSRAWKGLECCECGRLASKPPIKQATDSQ